MNPHTEIVATGTPLHTMTEAVTQQIAPSGSVRTDLTNAAYLVFSGLLVAGSAVAILYGRRALISVGRRVGSRASRIASGVADRLSDDLEQRLRINEYSEEGRSRVLSGMVDNWIRQGRDDATIAGGIRALRLLEEPIDSRRLLEGNFSARALSKEAFGGKKPVYSKVLDFYDTVVALTHGSDVGMPEREKLLAALALHLPEPGERVPMECASIIDSLRAMGVQVAPGIRMLAHGDQAKLAAMKERPGVKLLNAVSAPVHTIYRVEAPVFTHRETVGEVFVQERCAPSPIVHVIELPDSGSAEAAKRLAGTEGSTPVVSMS